MPIRQLEFTSAYCAVLSRSYLQVFALSKLQRTQQLLCAHSHMHKPLIMYTGTCAHSPMPLMMYTCYRVQGDIQSRRQAVATAAPLRLQGWVSNCALGNWHCQVVHKPLTECSMQGKGITGSTGYRNFHRQIWGLCSFAEPVMNVAASQYVHDIGVTAQTGCSKTAPHKLISRHQTQPLQLLMPCTAC